MRKNKNLINIKNYVIKSHILPERVCLYEKEK